jgi:hypothetical protein
MSFIRRLASVLARAQSELTTSTHTTLPFASVYTGSLVTIMGRPLPAVNSENSAGHHIGVCLQLPEAAHCASQGSRSSLAIISGQLVLSIFGSYSDSVCVCVDLLTMVLVRVNFKEFAAADERGTSEEKTANSSNS